MKTLERNGFLLILLMGGLVAAADYYDLPWLFSLLLVALGLAACLGAIRILMRGEAFEGRSRLGNPRFVRRYAGLSAKLIAFVLLLAGPIIVVLGLMEVSSPGRASGFLSGLSDSPYGWATILGLAGLMVTAMGITRILSGSALPRGTYARHVELSLRVGGAYTALTGLAMLALAAAALFAPDLLNQLLEQLKELLEQAVRLAMRWMENQ